MISIDLITALPELFLSVTALVLLMVGVYWGRDSTRMVLLLSVGAVAVAFVLVLLHPRNAPDAFGGLFVADRFGDFMKLLVLLGSGLTIAMSLRYIEREQMARFEFPILMLFATIGMLLMVSANDLIALYLGLELQSLSLYVIAAIRRDNLRSSEAGLKYFVLGALSSGMLLYGCSLVYGFAGSTGFPALGEIFAAMVAAGETPAVGLILGLVFVIAGLAFKISAVPFHMWTPDVYEGAPTPVTAFFANAPKVAAMGLLVRVMMDPFGDLFAQWQQIVIFVSIASMVLGALVGLAAGSEAGVRGIAIYMAIYIVMNVGTFACILCMRQRGRMVEGIEDLKGLSKTNPMMALAMAIFMFSMAGIPPLAGFFGKLYVFLAAIEAGLYTLAVIGVLTSVVGAFYYMRIVRLMYFDEPAESFDTPIGREMTAILLTTSVAITLFFVALNPVLHSAQSAAAVLFAG
jgi:NADH-quinone oxidoreductase subunit N